MERQARTDFLGISERMDASIPKIKKEQKTEKVRRRRDENIENGWMTLFVFVLFLVLCRFYVYKTVIVIAIAIVL
jgi:hypothetical protein